MKLYVGNLSYNTTSESLKAHFAPFGAVASANVIIDKATNRSKGFGFVEMNNNDEADKAMKDLDGKDLDGRSIRVNEAKPMTDRPKGDRPFRPRSF